MVQRTSFLYFWLHCQTVRLHFSGECQTFEPECQGDGSLDNFLFILYSVQEVIHHVKKSQNAE